MASLRPLIAALALLGAGCTVFDTADLRPLLEQQNFPVSQGPAPADTENVGLIVVRDSGFYLFGFVPVVAIRVSNCVEALVGEAQRLGADGVAEIHVRYEPPNLLSFTPLFLPYWFAFVELHGSAWRKRAR